jgi:hypothetical protein
MSDDVIAASFRSRENSLGIVTELRTGNRGIIIRFPKGVKDLSLSRYVQTVCGARLRFCSICTEAIYLGLKRSGRDGEYLPHSSTYFKHRWIYTSTPLCLRAVYRNNLTVCPCSPPFSVHYHRIAVSSSCSEVK